MQSLAHLSTLRHLETLALTSEDITATGIAVIAEIPKLTRVHLDAPLMADDCIPSLLRCSSLDAMLIHRSALSDAGLQRLRDGLPKCGVEDFQRDYPEEPPYDSAADRFELRSDTPFKTLLAEGSDLELVEATFRKFTPVVGTR